MKQETCILCGRTFPTGLNILGCLICFPCEKMLLCGSLSAVRRKRLCQLYAPAKTLLLSPL